MMMMMVQLFVLVGVIACEQRPNAGNGVDYLGPEKIPASSE